MYRFFLSYLWWESVLPNEESSPRAIQAGHIGHLLKMYTSSDTAPFSHPWKNSIHHAYTPFHKFSQPLNMEKNAKSVKEKQEGQKGGQRNVLERYTQ
mmetsp:Transcript_17585/g.26212  ORF Transcript_17585/g.26212 Transcript_17585/m.26212 type:complete len:97 (-) Transcript_17585:368-658(-)